MMESMETEHSDINLMQDVKNKALKSIKWSVFAELVPKVIIPVTTLIFVRVLLPADFGLMTIATIFVGLAGAFQDFGLAKALIREKDDIKNSANVVFWSNISLGAVMYLLIFFLAPLIASFFHEPRLVSVLRVLCVEIILSALISVQYAILQRDFHFRKIFLSGLGFVLMPVVVTLPLAILHFGVWALVLGSVSGYCFQVVVLWFVSDWRPRFRFDIPVAKKLFKFGVWFTAEALTLWILSYGDSAAVGHYLGVNDVGVYYIGMTITMLIFGTIFNPLLGVSYSSFSKLQYNLDHLRHSFLRVNQLSALICIPMGVGLILIVSPLYSIFFQNKWQGVQAVIALLAAMQMIAWLVGTNSTLYRTIGRPDINFKIGVVSLFFYLPAYIFFAQLGLFMFCVGRLLVAIITDGIHIFVIHKTLKISPLYLFDCIKIPVIAVIPMALLVYGLIYVSGSFLGILGITKLLAIIILGAGVYAGALYFISKESFKQSFSLFLKVLR